MTKKTGDKDFVLAFEQLSDDVPMDAKEIKETLASVGLDAGAELARTMAALGEISERERKERFARAGRDRVGALELKRLFSEFKLPDKDGKDVDVDVADSIDTVTCPACGHEFAT